MKRIEEARTESRRLNEEIIRLQTEQDARLKIEEAARQRAEEQVRNEEARALQRAQAELELINQLASVREAAEKEAQLRAEKIEHLNAEIEAHSKVELEQSAQILDVEARFSQAQKEVERVNSLAAEQLTRSEQAEAALIAREEARQAAEAEAGCIAVEEEQRLTEIEALRNESKAQLVLKRTAASRLKAQVAILRKAEAKNSERREATVTPFTKLTPGLESRQSRKRCCWQNLILFSARRAKQRDVAAKEQSIKTRSNLSHKAEAHQLTRLENWTRNFAPSQNVYNKRHWSPITARVTPGQNRSCPRRRAGTGKQSGRDAEIGAIAANVHETKQLEGEARRELDSQANNPALKRGRRIWFTRKSLQASRVKPTPNQVREGLRSEDPAKRAAALKDLPQLDEGEGFGLITSLFDDSAEEIRNQAARALYEFKPDRAASFTRALREASAERRHNIAAAINSSGLANEAINSLAGDSRERTYDAFSILFLMAEAGEVQMLLQTIAKHSDLAVRLSVIRLLTFSNQAEIIPAFRSLAIKAALPLEVRSALMEAIYKIGSNAREHDFGSVTRRAHCH